MTQIVPGPMNTSNATAVDAYELDDSGNLERVVCLAIGDIEGAHTNLRAMVEMTPSGARELAFELIDAADLAEGECHLRRVTARAVLS
ncbi:hypothetical protein KY389_11390 [Paracoccus bogoriensis]|uniref:hypothetical protein n=1 Tax=Paracoccus bogoriensis TaxID=242065 RepID=UPI001CA5B465|nr:hypothetical protein [Paracoccus bogoriensis]MBW7057288.1 hypothetical protein [Paracoccus bogoriensis]